MTLANFHYIFVEYDLTRLAIENSLLLATLAVAATTVIGGLGAYISVKTRSGAGSWSTCWRRYRTPFPAPSWHWR